MPPQITRYASSHRTNKCLLRNQLIIPVANRSRRKSRVRDEEGGETARYARSLGDLARFRGTVGWRASEATRARAPGTMRLEHKDDPR